MQPEEKKFDIIEHTADAGIVAYGVSLKEAFANVAYGMFSLIADLDRVKEDFRRNVEVEADDLEGLVIAWLNDLLYLLDVEGVIFKRFEITSLTGTSLKAEVFGERIDRSRHNLKAGIKAATYHTLEIHQNAGYSIRVIFDI